MMHSSSTSANHARCRRFVVALLASTVAAGINAAERGALPLPAAKDIPALCDRTVADMDATVKAIEALPLADVTIANTLEPWSRMQGEMSDVWWVGGLLANVSPDADVRAAEEACDLKIQGYVNTMLQRPELYARFKAVRPADEIDAETLRSTLYEFEEKGVNLAPDRREHAAMIFSRLDKLQQDFARNVRENTTRLTFTADELTGLADEDLNRLARDDDGNYLVGFDYPEYFPVMESALSDETRRRMYVGFQTRGGPENLHILDEVVGLRLELAHLMGFASFAEFVTENRMTGTPQVVQKFLDDVINTVTDVERQELAELAAEKAKVMEVPAAVINRWDISFYQRRIQRARYDIDQAEVRRQFPTLPTVNWLLAISSRLYGVEFRENAELPRWQADVKAYDVFDVDSGDYLSTFYLDMFPREGKYKHAAAFSVRPASTLIGMTPVSVLVTNFNPAGFDQDELETLFHEFGHIMHGVLSRTRYTINAGTSTKRDFVEAPSQMFEAWSRDDSTAAIWNEVCADCTPLNLELLARMRKARLFGQGIAYARQWLYASFDMALAGPEKHDPLKLWQTMERQSPLGYVEGTEFPGTFTHIVGGYAAGYYGYMWSEVLALDMRSAFGDNLLNAEAGARFRSIVLANGSQYPEMDMVRRFLGREPNSQAFFQQLTRGIEQKD
ncbi:MAG: Zn-dependent oligopeptidase [Gammaproteobacteria bacterium]|nr:Zn-dependent oligopeptidase [Gammaproteobacteria bacterium]